ncbi:extracellular solute-binding protein [Paenibacillus jiagnxiensis]|uniref:extracellular solute-binding protein n=1 Tax=Paenibacillus jiagnxiensis TaxID=3228926 RepID=UPI0033B56726
MDSWKKKALPFSLSVLLVMMLGLTGCSGSGGGEKGPATAEGEPVTLGAGPLTFSFYGHYDWYTMPVWGEDIATKWIQENKKVTVEPISSGGNAKQKLSTIIVSGELPDVIWLERGPDVEKLRAAGMLVPFDDYLDKYPNLKKWAGESTLDMLRSPDGKLYQFPNWYTTQPNGNAGYVVNKKIYKELGSPPLETTDDFYAYLKMVKGKYPDVIPFEVGEKANGVSILTTAFAEKRPYLFNSMMAVPNGDQLTSIFKDPAYREGLQLANKLYREGLITQDAFTQKPEQIEQKIRNGQVAVYAASSPTEYGSVGNAVLSAEDPEAGYFMIWPLHKEGLDKNNIFPGDYKQQGWNVSVITQSAKNPEAIFAFLDWMTGPEGQRVIMWGPEGTFWNGVDEDEAPLFTEKYVKDAKERDEFMNSTVNLQWVGNTVYVDNSKMKFEKTLPPEKQNWESRWQSEITWKTQYNTTEFTNLDPAGDSDEGIVAQSVLDIYDKAFAASVMSAKSEDEVLAILDQAEADAQQAGYERLLKYKTERWQENLSKLK